VLNRHAASALRGKVAIYVVGGASLLAFCAALAVLDAERRNHDASITDFGDAMWWAVTTMTTVGYGDEYLPRPGRFVASVLMVAGIALLGTVTATLASWLVEQVSQTEDREVLDLRTEIEVQHQDRSTAQHNATSRSQQLPRLSRLPPSQRAPLIPLIGWWAIRTLPSCRRQPLDPPRESY